MQQKPGELFRRGTQQRTLDEVHRAIFNYQAARYSTSNDNVRRIAHILIWIRGDLTNTGKLCMIFNDLPEKLSRSIEPPEGFEKFVILRWREDFLKASKWSTIFSILRRPDLRSVFSFPGLILRLNWPICSAGENPLFSHFPLCFR